jgi:acetyl-CoA C-acetyltransferase
LNQTSRPVLIGAAQLSERGLELDTALSPLDMLVRIAREAAASSGADPKLLEDLDTIGFTNIMGWNPTNGPALLAEAVGAKPAMQIMSAVGGETSIGLTNAIAERVARGESQLALVAGCNNLRTLGLARKAKHRFDWPEGGAGEATPFGKDKWGTSKAEQAVGLNMPIEVYPLFENALRAARGQTLSEHRRAMGELFAPFTRVAANNPHAWFPTERSATELVDVTPTNRMIRFPYTKYLNAVMNTDQAAGALIASEEMARRLGVPESDWVYWRGGALEIEDPWFASERPSYAESPSLASCHFRALSNAGIELDDVDLFDFYSCFPSAVAMACEMLGLAQGDPRGLTLTGGLPYAGGPGNSYSLHALASAVDALRAGRGTHAFLSGNGWYLTKHSAVVLSREPGPPDPLSAQAGASGTPESRGWKAPPVELREEASGAARVETYTIVHGRDGRPEAGIIVGRLAESGDRFLANTPNDPELLESLESEEVIGITGHVESVDAKNVFRPN